MTLPLRVPRLQSLARLLVRTPPWRSMRGPLACLPPVLSRDDDDLLSGNVAAGVEVGLAHLTISSPSGQEAEGEEASCAEVPPPPEEA